MLTVVNPATSQVIAELNVDPHGSIIHKITKSRRAQAQWRQTEYHVRQEVVRHFGQLIKNKSADLALLLTTEMGKPITQSLAEIEGVATRIEFFLENTERLMATEQMLKSPSGRLVEQLHWAPLGVVANISAWNYPYFVGSNVFLPALLTGNSVMYKPSEYASQSGLAIAQLWQEAGLPEGVFQTVIGAGEVGKALVDANIDAVFFTGSGATGQKIAQAVAGRNIPVQLELGGKDAVYVTDAIDNIEQAAADIACGAMYNAGQSCCSVERVYVHQAIEKKFIEAFTHEIKTMAPGDPLLPSTQMGPLARQAQIAVLEAQVADALQKGANLVCGGKAIAGTGYYFEPTLLTGVDQSMQVMHTESFGPLVALHSVTDDNQAIELINDSCYGLTASVYCSDSQRVTELMQSIQAGTLYQNCCDRVSPRLPWTGWKASGIGSTLGDVGIRAFMKPQSRIIKVFP